MIVDYVHATCTCHVVVIIVVVLVIVVIVVVVIVVVIIVVVLNSFVGEAMIHALPSYYITQVVSQQVDGGPRSSPCHCPLCRPLHRCCRSSVVSGTTNPNVFYLGRPCAMHTC